MVHLPTRAFRSARSVRAMSCTLAGLCIAMVFSANVTLFGYGFGMNPVLARRGVAYRPDPTNIDRHAVDYNTLSRVGMGNGGDDPSPAELFAQRERADRFENDEKTYGGSDMALSTTSTSVTLLDRLKNTPNENILRQTARVSRLDAILDDPEREMTVFAPTDRAFEFLPEGALEFIEAKPRELKYVIQSHITQGVIDSTEFRDGMMFSGLDGTTHEIHRVTADGGANGASYWTIDGIRIIEGDIFAENGVIHKIDGILGSTKVILPSKENLRAASDVCRIDRGFRGFQLAQCVRQVAQGLDSQDVPTRPDLEDLP